MIERDTPLKDLDWPTVEELADKAKFGFKRGELMCIVANKNVGRPKTAIPFYSQHQVRPGLVISLEV